MATMGVMRVNSIVNERQDANGGGGSSSSSDMAQQQQQQQQQQQHQLQVQMQQEHQQHMQFQQQLQQQQQQQLQQQIMGQGKNAWVVPMDASVRAALVLPQVVPTSGPAGTVVGVTGALRFDFCARA